MPKKNPRIVFSHKEQANKKKNSNSAIKNATVSTDAFNGQEVEFPVTYDIKIIVEKIIEPSKQIEDFKKLFSNRSIPCGKWTYKESSKGKYISYTASITVKSKEEMISLYDDLKHVKGVKMVI